MASSSNGGGLAGDDVLMGLMQESPFLDTVEAALRDAGRGGLADGLLKIQQDAGVQFAGGFDSYDPKAGPETAKLDNASQPVTTGRLAETLSTVGNALPQGPMRETIARLRAEWAPADIAPPSSKKTPGGPGGI